MPNYSIGERISVLLVTRDMSQAELSRLSGVPVTTISMLRNTDGRKATFETIHALAQALDVSVCYLGTGKEETKKSRV